MADIAVTLPEPRPDDDEDVVWGLSTASALWARGERGDAVVWVRRAMDAAAAAGMEARAAELATEAVRIEQALEEHVRSTMPPPVVAAEPALPEGASLKAAPVPDRISLGIEVEFEPSVDSARARPEGRDAPVSAPSPARVAPAKPPSVPSPPVASPVKPPSAPVKPPSAPAKAPSVPAPPAAAPAPLAAGAKAPVRPPSATPPAHAAGAPAKPSAAPSPPAHAAKPSAAPVPTPAPPAARAPSPPPASHAPAPPAANVPEPPPPRAPLPSYTFIGRPRTVARSPILDPWADESTLPSMRVALPASDVRVEGDQVMVQMRRPTQARGAVVDEDSDVITSAAPLEITLRKTRPPPPPARKPSEQAPGQVADVAAVPAKSAPRPPPAPQPSALPAPRPVESARARPEGRDAPVESPTLPSTPSPLARARSVPPPAVASAPPVAPQPSAPAPPAAPKPAVPASAVRMSPSAAPRPAPTSPASVRPPASASVRPPPRPPVVHDVAPSAPASHAGAQASPRTGALPAPPAIPRVAAPRPAISFDDIEAFSELAGEVRQRLAELARVETLGFEEEVSGFGAALVLDGRAAVCATIVDAAVAQIGPGTLVTTRGTAGEGVALRLVGGAEGASVATWDAATIEECLRANPLVLDDLAERADRLQAMAGATMGPLHDLSDDARGKILDRMRARVLRPREVLLPAGVEVPGAILVCAGAIEVGEEGAVTTLTGGAALFPREAAHGGHAPSAARAGAAGAIVMLGDRALATELAPVLSA